MSSVTDRRCVVWKLWVFTRQRTSHRRCWVTLRKTQHFWSLTRDKCQDLSASAVWMLTFSATPASWRGRRFRSVCPQTSQQLLDDCAEMWFRLSCFCHGEPWRLCWSSDFPPHAISRFICICAVYDYVFAKLTIPTDFHTSSHLTNHCKVNVIDCQVGKTELREGASDAVWPPDTRFPSLL